MASFPLHIPRLIRRKAKMPQPGSAPGTLAAPSGLPEPVLQRWTFDERECQLEEMDAGALDRAFAPAPGKVRWIDVQGLGDGQEIRKMGELLGLHPLSVEDIMHVHQRPKVEDFGAHLFLIVRMLVERDDGSVANEQLSVIFTEDSVITFQERPGDVFAPVRERLRAGKGTIRKSGGAYLAYALVDAIIDGYYPVLERYMDVMDQLDDAIREQPSPTLSRSVHQMRRELRQFRRAIWPLRDVVSSLSRDNFALIPEPIRPAWRDCLDHVIQAADIIEGGRERASELADLHLVMTGERTNQVMKVLTIIATIFIPLTFLCGLYGMNFDPEVSPYNMPELKWRYGYLFLWGVMISVFLGMLWFFRRKGWIGRERD